MSAILSYEFGNAVIVLTDGAVYNTAGVILDVRRKIHTSQKIPVAVATRGGQLWGDMVSKYIISLVEEHGFDLGLDLLSSCLREFGVGEREADVIEVLIAGVSEAAGPCHRVFSTIDMSDKPAFELQYPGRSFWGMPSDGGAYDFSDMGVRNLFPWEMPEEFFIDQGPKIFDFFRRQRCQPAVWSEWKEPRHLIGGQLDLTLVMAEGLRTSTIHKWDDRIGRMIKPAPAMPFQAATLQGMNRKQRRAAAKRAA